MTAETTARRSPVSILRRVIVAVIIASFSIAALGGIVVLLGGALNDTAGRVLTTTAIVGAFSIAVLCCAALAGRRLQTFGLAGAAISILTAALIVALVWWPSSWPDELWRVTWTGVAATVAASLASLLLLLADRTQRAVRTGLVVTLALFGLVLAMTLVVIWWPDIVDDDVFPRVLGIAAILAALGAVVVPVISLLLKGRAASHRISPATLARLERAADERGTTVDALVDELLVHATEPVAPAPRATP